MYTTLCGRMCVRVYIRFVSVLTRRFDVHFLGKTVFLLVLLSALSSQALSFCAGGRF